QGYTFDSSGEPFDPQNLVNESPHNDGLTELPVPQEPTIWYTYSWDTLLNSPPDYATEYLPDESPFPQMEGGAPMGGPILRSSSGSEAMPQYLVASQSPLDFASGSLNCEITAHGCFG